MSYETHEIFQSLFILFQMLVINFTRAYEMNQILFVAKRNAEMVILKEKVAVEKDAQRMVKSVARVV